MSLRQERDLKYVERELKHEILPSRKMCNWAKILGSGRLALVNDL